MCLWWHIKINRHLTSRLPPVGGKEHWCIWLDVLDATQGLICVGTVGNAAPMLIFRWERCSHTYSYFPVGTQFLQCSITISIRPILVAQQTTILPLMNVFIYLRAVLRIKLGPVIAPDRHNNCSPFSPSPPSSPFRFPSPFPFPFRGLRPSRQTQLAGLGER